MQNPYYAQNTPPYAPHVSYDLPPVQSVTSPSSFHYPPAISAPPNNPASHTSSAHTTTTTTTPTPSSSTSTSTGSGLPMAHLLQPVSPQHPSLSSAPPYPRSYASSSGSPAEPTAVLPEHTAAAATAGSISGTSGFAAALGQAAHQSHSHSQSQSQPHQAGSAAAVAAAGLQQKRAYRQRRKDPSCDACRERKVKCDASESSSCTECNNRKVRCQFTKETNRRMSSIKQVQDLEKQLLSTKQQLQQLRSGNVKPESSLMDLDFIDATSATGQPGFKLPDVGSRPARRHLQPPAHTVSIDSSVRTNLRTYSQGIWNPPSTSSFTTTTTTNTPTLGVDAPPLPPKPMADHLLSQYHAYVHSTLPVVHWPDFLAEYEQVYRMGSLHGAPRDWAALLFSVLACGALHDPNPNHNHAEYNRQDLLRIASNVLDMSQDDFGIDRVRASLLISVALYEVNSKSACWVWIGAAVRLAQEQGLHLESVAADSELRRRLWWGVYTWDRLLALEMGKPALINDQDCEVDLPYPSDDDNNTTPDGQTPTQPSQLPTIQVMRSVGHLTRTLRSSTISASTLDSFERHFETCLSSFPTPYHPKSDLPVDPRFLDPVVYFQNARLLLHRHNLSPLSPTEARSAAFDACLGITLDTAHLISRSLHGSNQQQQQQRQTAVFVSSASASLCMHIWRCTLLLLFRQQYAAALACVHASALIGDLRVVNTACGRYLAFFLRCLLDRLYRGNGGAGGAPPDLSRDEELVAYAVGDLHVSSSFDSWVWGGDVPQSPATGAGSISSPSHSESAAPADWEGWEWIERTVQHLLVEQQQQQQQQQQQRPEASTHELARPNESTFRSPAATGEEDAKRSNSHSRMTIASII